MKNKPKPDDRTDNVDKIQFNIDNTIENYRRTQEVIRETEDEQIKQDLINKNEKRLESLKGMKEEIKDEATDKQRGYK
ncbi:small acid-soluble spore protein Tlp [Paratissierella segnis]|jgi:small acid-soluble spore protein (thioredoxin-like protein)|uniref:Small acid-soluble spore protein Tlp n=1 Tax=Paratissierella segnis TaxID=2763679 RepID=A0A926ERE4_9FIRM|nr:small acid-soluble spore protein Tlp [Paratissierella segnis]MBC8587135.1 small acid-soluble spore protein Tlp [Paratissierella segnis]